MAATGSGSSSDGSDIDLAQQNDRLFLGMTAYFVEAGAKPRRLEIWKRRVEEMGGRLEGHISNSTTHIFAMDTKSLLDRVNNAKLEKLKRMKVSFLRYEWIQECLKAGALLRTDAYELALMAEPEREQSKLQSLEESNSTATIIQQDQAQSPVNEKFSKWMQIIEEGAKLGVVGSRHSKTLPQGATNEMEILHQSMGNQDTAKGDESDHHILSTTAAAFSKEQPGIQKVAKLYTPPDLNKDITRHFEELKNIYKDAIGDDRRSFSYYKALSVLEKLPFKITSVDQVKGLPTIGKSMQDHIQEILTTGKLSKLEHFKNDEKVRTVTLFGSIWGIGPATAQKLYEKGHRSLEDLKSEPSLTAAQRVGLLHHHDITKKIDRKVAMEIEAILQETAQAIQPGTIVVCGGSYRRGKALIGDMDIVITHPDGHSHKGLLRPLVQRLKDMNFLTEDLLVSVDHASKGSAEGVDTYYGLCKSPGREQRHRIDFKVYSAAQYPFGLIAWTGNDVLNRRLRLVAESKGYRLDDTGLYPMARDTQGNKILSTAQAVPCKTERQVFEFLGFPYLEPHERNL